MNHRISSHHQFDDDRYWRFARSSGLPRGYFDRKRVSVDAVVVFVSVVCFVAALAVAL